METSTGSHLFRSVAIATGCGKRSLVHKQRPAGTTSQSAIAAVTAFADQVVASLKPAESTISKLGQQIGDDQLEPLIGVPVG